jgi:hypothetical protein
MQYEKEMQATNGTAGDLGGFWRSIEDRGGRGLGS